MSIALSIGSFDLKEISFWLFLFLLVIALNLVCIVFLFKVAHDLLILLSALLSCSHHFGALDAEKILSALNRLKSMSYHDDCQVHFF